jgi:hypothetical protein
MGERTRNFDWSTTSVGNPDTWPKSLQITVGIILSSRFPMFLWWGEEMIQFYNDAYRPSLGEDGKHPSALGQKGEECWPEIWHIIYPLIRQVQTTGEPTWSQDQLVPIYRNGRLEDVYWTFGYSAVHGEAGEVAGVLVICHETTETVLGRKRLEKSAANLRRMILQAPVAMCILVGYQHVIEVANQRMLELWGRQETDVIGKPVFDALPEARGQGLEDAMDKVYRTGETFEAREMPVSLMRNGVSEVVYQNFVYEPYWDNDGNLLGIIAITIDISEQVLAKKQLEQINVQLSIVNENFRNIILQAPVAMGLFRGENMVVEVINDNFLKLWDRDRSVVGKTVLEALPELKEQPYPQILRDVFHSGETYYANQAKVFLKRNGRLEAGYYDFINQAFRNSDGQIVGVVVVAHEVTEQVLASKHLQTALNQSRLSKEAAALGTFDMDLQEGTMIWDARCRELFGISHQNDVTYAQDFVNGMHPDDRERITRIIDNCFIKSVSGGVYDVEYRTMGQEDGRERWVRAKGQVYFDENERPVRFIGSVLEITEQKNDELRKNDFIAMVSHELKTPLTTLTAVIQLLSGKISEPFVAGWLKTADKQVKKMAKLISGFLNLSRLEAGKIVLEKERFDIAELIQTVIEEQKVIIGNHEIVFNKPEPLFISADQEKIGSVISNFLSNADKYSPPQSLIIVNCVQDSGFVKVSVTDEGNGIKPGDIKRLFERFYRVEDKNHAHVGGFGIGLYLSAEIIQRHNGNIGVDSEVGKGSTFYFTLPLAVINIPKQ